MPEKITYATVYTEGLSDAEASAEFERLLAAGREAGPRECPHRVEGVALREGEPYERRDPCDSSRVVASAQHAPRELVERAVAAARRAAPAWRRTPYEERCALLERVGGVVGERRLELAALLSLEVGKTRADALAEIDECVAIVELFCEQMRTNDAYNVALRPPSSSAYAGVALAPYGVFGVIAPFNFPFAIPVGMIAAALVTGNTAVFKPSALSPACGEAAYDLFASAGAPTGVVSLVHGGGETGTALAESSVDGLVFTGSAQVGLALAHQFASPPYLRPLIAEMGGKNPAIVTGAAADVGMAARAVAHSAYGMSGQKCNACSRAVVTGDVYDEFLAALCDYAASLRVTDPLDASAFTGPVVNEEARSRFRRSVESARRDGVVRLGGEARDGAGIFVDLTVVDGLPRGHELTREELFLPLLCLTRVDSFDEALAEANAIRYGLSAGLFSEDEAERARFLDEIEAGIVFVNNPGGATTGVWPGSQTMAGWKGSGSTGKGGFGPYYLQQFLREQSRTIVG